MGNLKHTIAAMLAVVMISSLAVSQASDLKESYNIASLLSTTSADSVLYEEQPADDLFVVASEEEVQAELNEQYTEEELNAIIEEKSHASTAYVFLTTGILSVREAPSYDSAEIDSLEKNTQIEIIESTEEWFKIRYADGKTGYAAKEQITEDKDKAELAAKYYDNYRYGKIKTDGGEVNIRKGPSTSTDILGELANGSQVLLYWDDSGFTKICYGTDYLDGYVISTAIELLDEWMPKGQLTVKKQEVAERKAREQAEKERKEKEAKEKAAKEAAAKKKAEQEKANSSKTADTSGGNPASSSKGASIVATAKKYLGVKYVYGGASPSGFDCSGLVKYVCAKNGISMSRTSAAQANQGKAVSWSNLQPGDLLFFAKNGRVHHVGIYVGGGQMIHAPHTGAVVRYDSINTAYRKKEFYCARRVY